METDSTLILDGRLDKSQYITEYQNMRWNNKYGPRMKSNLTWHKFLVLNSAHLQKEHILRTIINALLPTDIIPFKFHVKKENSIFYARDCLSALDTLVRLHLKIENPPDEPLILVVELMTPEMVTSVTAAAVLASTVSKKYDIPTLTVNLSSFHKDPDLDQVMFCPLSIPRMLSDVMNLVNRKIVSLDLSNNQMITIDTSHLGVFFDLRVLDLSNNELEINNLEPLRGLKITELILDGNPLCRRFEKDSNYVEAVRNYLPDIRKLDGINLCPVGPPRMLKYYMCVPAKQFVEQFIEHYFSLYDSKHRHLLLGTYHPEAQFSITTSYLPNQTTSNSARLTRYVTENRNLLRLSDYNKMNNLVRKGQKEITDVLCKLPVTQHDPSSFTVDLIFHSHESALLSITGVFREPENPSCSIRFFKRQFTFLSLAPGGSAFQVINEMLFVNNCTTQQAQQASFHHKAKTATPLPIYLSCLSSGKHTKAEKRDMMDTMTGLTDMNRSWCRKCLIDVKWDIRAALILFNDCYKGGTIPPEAFIK